MDNRTDTQKESSQFFDRWVYTGNKLQQKLKVGPRKAMYNRQGKMTDMIAALEGGQVAEITFSTPEGSYNITDSAKKALLKPNWWEEYTGALEGSNYSHLYKKSQWAYRCVQIRSHALGAIPWKLVKGEVEVENGDIYDLLSEVNPETNWEDLIRATEADLNIYPGAYWLKVRGDSGKVVFLQRLNPANMEVIATKTGIKGFKQNTGSGKSFEREDIIYFHSYDPVSDVTGTPPIQVARGDIEVEIEANKHLAAFFKNHAMPHFIFGVDTLDPNVIRKLTASWKQQQGTNTGGTAFVGGNAKPQEMGYSPDDLALQEIREESRRGICAAFGVPAALAGAWEAANYATMEIQRKFLYTEVIIPQARYLAGVINAELIQEIDPTIKFIFDWESLSIMQEDELVKAERYALLVQEGIMDRNAAAEELGVTPPVKQEIVAEIKAIKSTHLNKWKRKAVKCFKATKSASCEFESDEISPVTAGFIEARLETAKSVKDITSIFKIAEE